MQIKLALFVNVLCIYYRFSLKLQMCLLQITGYRKLYLDVEDLRKCSYNSNDEEHEKQLIEVKLYLSDSFNKFRFVSEMHFMSLWFTRVVPFCL